MRHEGATETAFSRLLSDTARPHRWTLIPKQGIRVGGELIVPDGTLHDEFHLPRGYWEAKDTDDDLDAEIGKKIDKHYPLLNTIFEDTRRAVLFQNGREAERFDITAPEPVRDLLTAFYSYTKPDTIEFGRAVEEFQSRVPELGRGLAALIAKAHTDNRAFAAAFAEFFALAREALNPNIRPEAVDEMLVQHLPTERLFRTVFRNPDFVRRNVIARQVDAVIAALVSRTFDRDEYLRPLDRFYRAIERAAEEAIDFQAKQHFLNTVYERFFRGYSVKVADTHGIVYTPQPIVDFMCASVSEVLRDEFGTVLGAEGVNVLDPCTGTGNFVVNLIRRVPKRDLPRVYRRQLFANEVMLLPYYVASLNIEHAFYEQAGEYEAFEGLCFADTLDLANPEQPRFEAFNEENAARVDRQKAATITVIVGNPPYNVGQLNENDNNKNRSYETVDGRVRATYVKASSATSVSKLNDPYVKFFRWATDRLGGRDGVVCFVSNNSFVGKIAFDGMRKHLLRDFTRVYHLHLEGEVRENPTLSGTQYNVFGIQVGVGITVAVRSAGHADRQLWFHRIDKHLRRRQKLEWLEQHGSMSGVPWAPLTPDPDGNWLVPDNSGEYGGFLPIGSKEGKAAEPGRARTIFKEYSLGIATHRDSTVYGFDAAGLGRRVADFVEAYNAEVDRFRRIGNKSDPATFPWARGVVWDRDLKQDAVRGRYATYNPAQVRKAMYRPFAPRWLYFDRLLNAEVYSMGKHYPTTEVESTNRSIVISDIGCRSSAPSALCCNAIPDLHLASSLDGHQCFPFYVYDEGGSRRENITNWSLDQFQRRYGQAVTKWDIFYYVYAILHHPGYKRRFAASLKQSLPRIPLASDFQAFARAGRELADLHTEYEEVGPYPLEYVKTPGVPLRYTIDDRMTQSKDKVSLRVNASLTLAGIPKEVFDYRLGNRSALEWVVDQYRVTEDARTGIKSDPNRPDDPQYIVNLVCQVVKVSLETVRIVNALPAEFSDVDAGVVGQGAI